MSENIYHVLLLEQQTIIKYKTADFSVSFLLPLTIYLGQTHGVP